MPKYRKRNLRFDRLFVWIMIALVVSSLTVLWNGKIVLANPNTDCAQDNCSESTVPQGKIAQISLPQFLELRKSNNPPYIVFDVRSLESYQTGHIPGAQSFPLSDISRQSALQRISQKTRVIVYCSSSGCSMSSNAAGLLSRYGYDVVDYHGGFSEWLKSNQPVEK